MRVIRLVLHVVFTGSPSRRICATLTHMPDAHPLTPRPNPPDDAHTGCVTMNVGGMRYEITYCVESREIKRGPAEVLQMPGSSSDVSQTTASIAADPSVGTNPADATSGRVMLDVDGRRFELTCRTESREIKRQPTEVLQMPDSSDVSAEATSNRRPR